MKKSPLIPALSSILLLSLFLSISFYSPQNLSAMSMTTLPNPVKIKIHFQRDGLQLVGHLFLPPDFDESQQYPALIVQGSVSSVKEMMPDNYAQRLSAEGFVTLDFDYASWGESEGQPRQNENVEGKLKDLRAAVSYLQQLSYVDQIGMVGVCTSGGNAAYLAANDNRVRAISAVVPWMYEPALAEPFWGKDALQTNHQKSLEARRHFLKTGENWTTQIFTNDPAVEGFNFTPAEYYYDKNRGGGIPNWKNEVSWSAWIDWVEVFDPISQARNIQIPTQVFSSDDALIPGQAKKFYDLLETEKELVWSTGYHFDFYDQPEELEKAISAIVPFMRKHLQGQAD